jgi:FMN reductase
MTGALKNALDHLPVNALAGKPVGVVTMGASNHHYLGADRHVRDVLAWFGAVVAPTSVYATSGDFQDGIPGERINHELDELLGSVVTLAEALARTGRRLGPTPLAARARS